MSSGASDGQERLAGDPASPWEQQYGFSRLIRFGRVVMLAGTTSVDASGVVLGDTPYEQTVEILDKIEHELGRVGASLEDVVRTRMYVTDISRADEVGRAHGERFAATRPAASMIEVRALIDPRMLVEIEVEAILS